MILIKIIDVYSLIVLVAFVLSWVQLPYDNPAVQLVHSLTEPLLQPIRRALPTLGRLDLSPMILLVGLQMLKRFLRAARKRFPAEQIIMKLREAEVVLAQGQTVGQAGKLIGVTVQTCYR